MNWKICEMMERTFMFSVGMLAELTGSNRQYLSRKIKRMVEDPEIRLQAEIRSNKEGYRISEEEVLRCFEKITPQEIEAYKAQYALRMPGIRKLTQQSETGQRYLEKERELLVEWKIRLAATAPDRKYSREMRAYLEETAQKIRHMQEEKLRELVLLEDLLENSSRVLAELQERLEEWPE